MFNVCFSPARKLRGAAFFAATLVTSTALATVPAGSAGASTANNAVVISEVYGAGGNAGASLNQDYVELYNPTDAIVSLAGTSVQYRSATGAANPSGVVALTGSIPAHGHYLVGLASGTAGTALPTPDQVATGVNLSGSAGTVFLANQTAALAAPPTGSVLGNASILDLVGFGTSNTFETATAPAPSSTNSISRSATGVDTDSNSSDFASGAPSPANVGTVEEPPGDTDPIPATIAEIQGPGATSPLDSKLVITKGVVTANYATGGFRGFYLQTPGTGGSSASAASDAVFVYLGGAPESAYPAQGAYVSVTGTVSEFAGLTEVSPAAAATDVVALPDAVTAPAPLTIAWPDVAQRESIEGMLFAPKGDFTVSDTYTLNQYAEIPIATGTTPLRTPTDVARPSTPEAAAVVADNAARGVTLDDGSSTNYFTTGKDTPLPWLTPATPVRVGAAVNFNQPVVVDYRNNTWKFQPTTQLTAANAATVQPATFPNTRTDQPDAVGGDLKVASFNVLNYFNETGEDFIADGGTCSSYNDRAGNPITVNSCNGDGPRGAWDAVNRQRQQDKIVKAINALGADVLGLEEIENSAKYGGPDGRDAALAKLVDGLNVDAGSDVWEFVPSPPVDQRPTVAEEDVIRTAFIYKLAVAEPVGPSHILTGSAAFANAREPLVQVFRPLGGEVDSQFLVEVNHWKSKGSGSGADADQGDGQGASNASRVAQANAVVAFVDGIKAATTTSRAFLVGDFNSYTQEDPMQVLYEAGYTDIGSTFAHEFTYVFGGAVGSLDHVLANDTAKEAITGAAVWNINSVESVAYEYSRYNYNATDFYAANPYRSSDHDPLLVGFTNPVAPVDTSVTASVSPGTIVARTTDAVLTATVANADGAAGGTVEVRNGATVLGSGPVVNGVATVNLPKFASAGTFTLTVDYLGTPTAKPSSTTVELTVVRAEAQVGVVVTPNPVKEGVQPTATVTVTGPGGPVTGQVLLSNGATLIGVAEVTNGTASLTLPAQKKKGNYSFSTVYSGNEYLNSALSFTTYQVVKK